MCSQKKKKYFPFQKPKYMSVRFLLPSELLSVTCFFRTHVQQKHTHTHQHRQLHCRIWLCMSIRKKAKVFFNAYYADGIW